jgi:hypothetical protein
VKRFVVSMVLVFSSFATANAAQTYPFTYTFNVPVALKELGPPGTQLYVQCWIYGGVGGSGSTAFSLDSTGSFKSAVPVSVQVQDTRAASSYKCEIPQGNTPQGALFVVPHNLAVVVSGSIGPKIQLLPIKAMPHAT